ncbi:MAG: CapA family protein, partial [Ruminococcus sp.]|nr:CapA family protein [Ruminococcus sp.]
MKLRKGRVAGAVIILTALVGTAVSCVGRTVEKMNYDDTASQTTVATTTTTTEPTTLPPPEDKVIHVVAVGDNLVQTAVYRNAQRHATDGTYDFLPLYENVRDIIESGDISIINQETLIANGEYEVSGSNFNFNSPVELGDDMIDLGFNVFTLANNHLMDKGTGGLEATLDYWDARVELHDIVVCGAYRNEYDMNNIRTMTVDGVTFAFLSYTEHLNGYSIPSDSELRVVRTSETDVMQEQIERAEEIADVVIVSAHWGVEDTHTVSEDRKLLARDMVEWGADVIIGHHPHTAETMEFITRTDGTKGFVYYSLGNFISAQTDNFNLVGEIADFDVVIDGETNEVTLENVGAIPVINHYDDGSFSNMRLYPYNMYTSELADGHGVPYA